MEQENKFKEINQMAQKCCDKFVFCGEKGSYQSINLYGRTPDLLYLLNKLYFTVRENLVQVFGEECADNMLKAVYIKPEDLVKETEKLMKDFSENLTQMIKDGDDDDAEDESCDCCDDSDKEDNDDAEEENEELEEVLRGLTSAIRDAVRSGHGNVICGHVDRSKNRS